VSEYHGQIIRGPLDAAVTLPGSKSLTNRALVIAALADGISVLQNVLLADDTHLMIEALRALDIAITLDPGEPRAEITGCGGHIPASEADIFCGNAGTVMRFVTAITTLGMGKYRLDGVERMRERPIGGLTNVLQSLGVGIEYEQREGYPPLIVHAHGLRGGNVAFDSPESSQMVSALLLAGPYARGDLMIEVTGDVHSLPYLKMTTALMDRFGVAVVEQFDNDGAKFIVAAPQRYQAANLAIEPDASNATYFLAAPAITGGRVMVTGLGTESLQGDARFVDVLERMGCTVERAPNQVAVIGPGQGEHLRGIDTDLNDMPDTVQTLAVLALFADGPTTIRNVANLRVKETDRIAALTRELTKLGAEVAEYPDGLRIQPPCQLRPAAIDTYNDHRMAMSFALATLKVPGLVINNPQCCAKTFPDFFARFERMARPS
jgi:3-phosphoshikimate 1-carboxyvinyltransferase